MILLRFFKLFFMRCLVLVECIIRWFFCIEWYLNIFSINFFVYFIKFNFFCVFLRIGLKERGFMIKVKYWFLSCIVNIFSCLVRMCFRNLNIFFRKVIVWFSYGMEFLFRGGFWGLRCRSSFSMYRYFIMVISRIFSIGIQSIMVVFFQVEFWIYCFLGVREVLRGFERLGMESFFYLDFVLVCKLQ